jgi:hypothetical protein
MADLSQYRLADDTDFDKLVALADSETGWSTVYDGADCKVWDQKVRKILRICFTNF